MRLPVCFSHDNLLRLPRLGTGAITALSSNELRIFQSLTDYATKRLDESALVVVFAFVESERLFIAIPEQMKGFDFHVSSFEGALQKRPEVLKPVSVDLATRIAFQVVYDLTVIIFLQIVIGHKRIRANARSCLNMLAHIAAKLRASSSLNNPQNDARQLIALCMYRALAPM